MKKWMVAAKKADFDAIAGKFNISPMLARIIRNRDVIGDEAIGMYLNGTVKDMHDPHLLKDIDRAAGIICAAVKSGTKIFVIGDYDIDGVCSSYILLKGIKGIGGDVTVRLPDRVADGYGMNAGMVDEAIDQGAGIILTCDNGIAAYDEIKYAKDNGLTVIVTDHHEVPFEDDKGEKRFKVPPADAVVDPKQEDCLYPFSEICGGMVAYKLMQCVFELAGKGSEMLDELLMFAGFATVGDVMELKDENRIAVKFTIDKLKTTDNIGMNCLIDVTGIDRMRISPYHIGFILGPCINATGRLDSATRALDMLMASSHEEALKTAEELKSLNDSRKEMTDKFRDKAIEMIDSDESYRDNRVLVVFLPDCHESLAGIIAGRIREKYCKPSIVLTRSEDCVKGSGRSIDAYDMHEELTKCNDLFIKFGGHKMAAGLSLDEENVDELRRRLNENCKLTDEEMADKLTADIALPLEYATMDLAKEIELLEPYGVGNPKPLFAIKDIKVSDIKVFGKNRNVVKMKLSPSSGRVRADAVMFGDGDEIADGLKAQDTISVMYELGINEYNGSRSAQLTIRDWRGNGA
ncbi:MAG: single-stranded-DNA-specific exonuclease RecJ [Lachnospiraceae bacterium]|nr:single-stranded-DNA-specific exonuclease RecJ [Lachnospiraceae bacterium]